MRRVTASVLTVFLLALSTSAATLPELFVKAKEQFKLGNYNDALASVATLDAESAKPGMEQERQKILPGLLFYKGASLAALGQADEAEAVFESFLAYQPNAKLDPALYPPKVIAALEAARKGRRPPRPRNRRRPASSPRRHRAFHPPESKPSVELGEDWAKGPAKYLLHFRGTAGLRALSTRSPARRHIAVFWKAHDPKPETPENEFREGSRGAWRLPTCGSTGRDPRLADRPRHGVRPARGRRYNGQKPLASATRRAPRIPQANPATAGRNSPWPSTAERATPRRAQINEVGGAARPSAARRQTRSRPGTTCARSCRRMSPTRSSPAVRDQGGLRQERPPAGAERAHGARRAKKLASGSDTLGAAGGPYSPRAGIP
jgi:hypothetical protein